MSSSALVQFSHAGVTSKYRYKLWLCSVSRLYELNTLPFLVKILATTIPLFSSNF